MTAGGDSSNSAVLTKADRPVVLAMLLARKERHGYLSNASVALAAESLGNSRSCIREWIRKGALPTGERPHYILNSDEIQAVYQSRGNISAAYRQRCKSGEDLPSESTFRRAVNDHFNKRMLERAKYGDKGADRFSLYGQVSYVHKAELLIIDSAQLPVPTLAKGYKIPRQPYITVAIWAGVCAIGGAVVTFTEPKQDDVLRAIGQAIRSSPSRGPFCGIPESIRSDNGGQMTANGVKRFAELFQIDRELSEGYRPQQNGRMERHIGTIKSLFLPTLPLVTHGPKRRDGSLYEASGSDVALPFEQVAKKFQEFVDTYNLERPHPSLDRRTPAQAWEDDPADVDVIDNRLIDFAILRSDFRTIQKQGIRFKNNNYIAPELDRIVGERVEVRFDGGDLRRIEVFHEGEWFCSAEPAAAASPELVLAVAEAREAHNKLERRDFTRAHRKTRVELKSMVAAGPVEITTVLSEDSAVRELDELNSRRRSRQGVPSAVDRATALGLGPQSSKKGTRHDP